jgi:threonine aldolase
VKIVQFASDNWAGATPEVMAALNAANEGFAPAYGGDGLTARVTERLAELFEREVAVWFVATGTAANSIGLAGLSRPGGLVLCSREAHINVDEWGATEFQSGGMKLVTMPETAGKVAPEVLAETLKRYPEGGRFGAPVALSLTNATELGTIYAPGEVSVLAALAHDAGLAVHMDGARFGNAVAALGASPADITWRAGVDMLSFGGTKNGCLAAEAIVVFSPDKLDDVRARRQRAGHTFSKSRYIAAQFEGYLADGKWLERAGHANAMADRLRDGIVSRGGRLGWQSAANEVFAVLSKSTIQRLQSAGASFYDWPAESALPQDRPAPDEDLVRLVTSWATSADEVDRFLGLL